MYSTTKWALTDGINVQAWEHAGVYFDVWDFGGQREYAHTHPIFYSVRCIFLVVWCIFGPVSLQGVLELRSTTSATPEC
jgi:hypothetical protein